MSSPTRGCRIRKIVPLLHRHWGTTFFTQDVAFFEPALCHAAYCLVFLDVRADDAAFNVRRFLRCLRFKTKADRMGIVARVHADGTHCWQRGQAQLAKVAWDLAR